MKHHSDRELGLLRCVSTTNVTIVLDEFSGDSSARPVHSIACMCAATSADVRE